MAATAAIGPVAQRRARRTWAKFAAAYAFVLPAFVVFTLFVIYPFVSSFYLSLTEWNGADPVKTFVGLRNYARLLQDDMLWLTLRHNVVWMVAGSVASIVTGLLLAMLLWSRPRGFLAFRTIYFMPQILGDAILGIIWVMIYQPRRGVLYELGELSGWDWLQGSFLGSVDLALWAVLVASVWASIGFFFVILLAGLQNVDMDLVDAATVDGANVWQRFKDVVVPQLSHVITMVTVLAMIGSLKVFGIIWSMTKGGPANATDVIATYAYREFAVTGNIGYSAALTMVMAGLALLLTVFFVRVRERGGT